MLKGAPDLHFETDSFSKPWHSHVIGSPIRNVSDATKTLPSSRIYAAKKGECSSELSVLLICVLHTLGREDIALWDADAFF